jgi:uncharacterized membrane protein YraQ (UPF0718 family)
VLWNGGISFGGVIAFIYGDLIVMPILDIYRKYYGWKVSAFLLGVFYVSMTVAALITEFLFQALGLVPVHREAIVLEAAIRFNYATILNVIFLTLAALMIVRFLRSGGREMLRMMG